MSARTQPITPAHRPARWPGVALVAGAIVTVVAEAISASAWTVRPYSYADDYVNFLGSPFVGEFKGITISSPLWFVMSAGWIISGMLVAAAGIQLGRRLAGIRRLTVVVLSLAQALGLVLFATIPLGQDTIDAGLLGVYLAGAFLSVIAGNALMVAIGRSADRVGLPRVVGVASTVLGIIGLVSIPVTYGWAPIGIAERISVYTFLAGALVTGTGLLLRRR
jgi:hypothetical protein